MKSHTIEVFERVNCRKFCGICCSHGDGYKESPFFSDVVTNQSLTETEFWGSASCCACINKVH
jgi:hypothetical protein